MQKVDDPEASAKLRASRRKKLLLAGAAGLLAGLAALDVVPPDLHAALRAVLLGL